MAKRYKVRDVLRLLQKDGPHEEKADCNSGGNPENGERL
jgi:hypothetical protein